MGCLASIGTEEEKWTFVFILEPASHIPSIRAMPRTARASVGGLCYHVLNRGNARAEIFRKPEDSAAFLALLRAAIERVSVRPLPGLLRHADTCSPGRVAHEGSGSESIPALAVDRTCAPLSSALSVEWPCVAGAVQGLSHSAGRPSLDGAAVHRAQSVTGRTGGAGGRVAVVKPAGAGQGRRVAAPLPRVGPVGLGGVGECSDDGGGSRGASTEREPRHAVRSRYLGPPDGAAVRAGVEPQSTRTAQGTHDKVECPLFSIRYF